MDKSVLRQELRSKRRALSPLQQQQAADALLHKLQGRMEFIRAQRIGFYLPVDGEISPLALIEKALLLGKSCFLPAIKRNHRLEFRLYDGSPLLSNRYGIGESQGPCCPLWMLDILLIPLVGYDQHGNRLGMGGGYYDRSLSALKHRPRGPTLWGIAHTCQYSEQLPTEAHDYRPDEIIAV